MRLFRVANDAEVSRHVAATLAQTAVFWTVFLFVLPELIQGLERTFLVPRRGLWRHHGEAIGAALFAAAGALGLWSGLVMAVRGRGTPLPLAAARELVASGPYRVVRNPMAVAGIAQGLAVGLWRDSAGVALYALTGALLWHVAVRPGEEQFLAQRFGAVFAAYRERVPLWLPRLLPPRVERALGAALLLAPLAASAWHIAHAVPAGAPPHAYWFVREAYAWTPVVAAGLLLGTLLSARNRTPAVTAPSPQTP